MADVQYDVSEKMRKLFEIKHKQRQEAKSYFAKFMHNPHRPMSELPFDPLFFRLNAAQAYRYEYFVVTPKVATLSFTLIILPCILLTAAFSHSHSKKEKLLRSGMVAYKDRSQKHMY